MKITIKTEKAKITTECATTAAAIVGALEARRPVEQPAPLTVPMVGEKWQGGIYAGIMRDPKTGECWHLIAAESDAPGKHEWSTAAAQIEHGPRLARAWTRGDHFGTEARSAQDGLENQNGLVELGPAYFPAMNAARTYDGGGYGDWYLPAITELGLCMSTIRDSMGRHSLWSSSQASQSTTWKLHPLQFLYHTPDKSLPLAVRPVRRIMISGANA